MLYDLNLDDKSYQEIKTDAVFHIPREYPEWTNYNSSDPGIILIQLFSWLKEAQQYHLNQLSIRKRLKYLKLLGTEIRHMRPAQGAVCVEPGLEQIGKELKLLKGTRFFAGSNPNEAMQNISANGYSGGLAFETVEQTFICPSKLIAAYMLQGNHLSRYHNIGNNFEKKILLYPFGEYPEVGNQCYFVLDRGLRKPYHKEGSQGCKADIYFDICTTYEVTRNPVGEEFIPLARLEWEYYCADGWEALEVVSDYTYGFLQSGTIRFCMEKEMDMDEELGAYQIRVTLKENYYDVAPLIQNIYLNEIELKQQYTICDYEDYELALPGQEVKELTIYSDLALAAGGKVELYLKKGQGFWLTEAFEREITKEGNVRITFQRPDWAEEGSLVCRLAAYEEWFEEKRIVGIGDAFANQEFGLNIPDILYDDFEIMGQDAAVGTFMGYHKVEDFDNCGPDDPAYLLDLGEQKLYFGNCENGMAPDGELRILRLRVSAGKSGNIKAGKIQECMDQPGLLVKQYKAAGGGRDNETIDQCFERFREEWKEVGRGVTYSDYEELVRKTPGLLILDSRVIPPLEWGTKGESPMENQISIVVQTKSFKGRDVRLNKRYRQNLEQMLRKRKMLGTSIRILDPEYIGIAVYVEIAVKPQYSDAREQIEEAVKTYLDERTWEIGSPVLCSTIYGILDTMPCVWKVQSLTVNARGNGCIRLINGDVALPPNGLAYLEELDISMRARDPEI